VALANKPGPNSGVRVCVGDPQDDPAGLLRVHDALISGGDLHPRAVLDADRLPQPTNLLRRGDDVCPGGDGQSVIRDRTVSIARTELNPRVVTQTLDLPRTLGRGDEQAARSIGRGGDPHRDGNRGSRTSVGGQGDELLLSQIRKHGHCASIAASLPSLVREDGTRASVHLDRPRAQQACRELEQTFGLRPVEGRERGAGERGFKPGELQVDVAGVLEPAPVARRRLERIVRACSTAAVDEADFVDRLRAERVLVRPRFTKGDREQVEGYSVALAPDGDGRPVWFGGGRLSRELTLPRLRATWPELDDGTVTSAWRSRRSASERTSTAASPAIEADAARQLQALRERLAGVRHEDHSTWSIVARDTAGVLAALSLRTEPTPGPIAAAGRAVARSAQLRAVQVTSRPMRVLPPTQNAAALLLRAGTRHHSPRAMVWQLSGLVKALSDMHRAAGELDRARELERGAMASLVAVSDAVSTAPRPGVAAGHAQPPARPQRPGFDRDVER
jgi:hypothetical protein